jgi:hypothetical protein
MEQFRSHWTNCHEIWYLIFFNLSRKFKFYWNLTKITGTLHEDKHTMLSYLSQFFCRMRYVLDKHYWENQNTHFMFNKFFPPKIMPFMRMWKNIVEPDRPQMAIWRMLIACSVSKATNAHSKFVIIIACQLQQWLKKRASMSCWI